MYQGFRLNLIKRRDMIIFGSIVVFFEAAVAVAKIGSSPKSSKACLNP